MSDSSAPDPGYFATIVERADAGDGDARDALFAALYSELHRLAESHIRRGKGFQMRRRAAARNPAH
jgi:hypothetical protein